MTARTSIFSLFSRPVPMVVPLALALVIAIGLAGYAGARRDADHYSAAVAALLPEQRTVLSLAFWSGLSQTEIAERTGTPLGTVKSRVRLGMIKLRDRLQLEAEDR